MTSKTAVFHKGQPMNVLCFQSIEEISAEEFLKCINKHKTFKMEPGVTLRNKDKISLGKTRVRALHQFTSWELGYKKQPAIKLRLETGVYLVGDSVYNQRDLYLFYENDDSEEVHKLVANLVTALPLILVEPGLEARIQQLQGYYYPDDTGTYKLIFCGDLSGPI